MNETFITFVYISIRLLVLKRKEIMKSHWIFMIVEELLQGPNKKDLFESFCVECEVCVDGYGLISIFL